jgi:hypothetical protein
VKEIGASLNSNIPESKFFKKKGKKRRRLTSKKILDLVFIFNSLRWKEKEIQL